MVFAKDEETFYSLQKEMQIAAKSLGYEQVLAQDMQNVKAQSAQRRAAVAEINN